MFLHWWQGLPKWNPAPKRVFFIVPDWKNCCYFVCFSVPVRLVPILILLSLLYQAFIPFKFPLLIFIPYLHLFLFLIFVLIIRCRCCFTAAVSLPVFLTAPRFDCCRCSSRHYLFCVPLSGTGCAPMMLSPWTSGFCFLLALRQLLHFILHFVSPLFLLLFHFISISAKFLLLLLLLFFTKPIPATLPFIAVTNPNFPIIYVFILLFLDWPLYPQYYLYLLLVKFMNLFALLALWIAYYLLHSLLLILFVPTFLFLHFLLTTPVPVPVPDFIIVILFYLHFSLNPVALACYYFIIIR